MRKACKLLNLGVTRLEKDIVKEPFFDHVVGAAAEKIAFRYLTGLIHRCTDGSGGKMISEEVRFELSNVRQVCDPAQKESSLEKNTSIAVRNASVQLIERRLRRRKVQGVSASKTAVN